MVRVDLKNKEPTPLNSTHFAKAAAPRRIEKTTIGKAHHLHTIFFNLHGSHIYFFFFSSSLTDTHAPKMWRRKNRLRHLLEKK